jgi:two-component system nitrate/nitrite response regulator NarL
MGRLLERESWAGDLHRRMDLCVTIERVMFPVIRQGVRGRAGFAGHIARATSIDGLHTALKDISQSKLACPPEVTGGLLRALFRMGPQSEESLSDPVLTRREGEMLNLIGQGLSNKEIETHLRLSVATVKHHVHNIFEKLGLTRRADAMRRVRDAPWLARVA